MSDPYAKMNYSDGLNDTAKPINMTPAKSKDQLEIEALTAAYLKKGGKIEKGKTRAMDPGALQNRGMSVK